MIFLRADSGSRDASDVVSMFIKEVFKMPELSVVIPIYNVERYLRECLDSVLAQTLEDIEIICVDDGSTDSSPEILREYAAADPRVRIISKPNSGYGHTMNTGFDAACGEYIGIVESDDVIPADMFETLCREARAHDCDVVKADFRTFIDEGTERRFTLRRLTEAVKKPESFYRRVIRPLDEPDVFRLIMNTWSGIYRTAFIRENNIRHNETPGASFQDNGLFFQTMALAQRVMFIDRPFYMLRRDNAASSVHNKNKVWALCEEYDCIYEFLAGRRELYDRLIGYFWLKRYHNYAWSYDERIGAEFREEFIRRFAEEFRRARDMGELDMSLLEKHEAARLERIMADPAQFHRKELPWLALRDETAGGKGNPLLRNLKRMRLCVHDRGLLYTVGHAVRRLTGGDAE